MIPFYCLLLLLTISLYLRISDKKRTAYTVPEHAKSSPFSEALQELIGQAGGIYLSLVLLVSFLQINISERWNIVGLEIEPLAFLALLLAAVQPLLLMIYRNI
ncbi:MAG: hypothetical protein GX893_07485 [Firmicutes bacterium]|nr:hypothetical protein [Bacillota bacterium]